MGYNTRYELDVTSTHPYLELNPVKRDEIIAYLRKANENASYCLTDNGDTSDSGKWYEHEAELKAFSKLYPNLLFTLSGEGEENDDMWKKYFLDGKVQIAKAVITLEAFEESKLR